MNLSTISKWRFIKHPFEWHEHFIFCSCWQCQHGTLFIMPIPKQIYLNLNMTLDSLIVSHQKMQFWSSVINRVYEISVLWLVRLIAPGETSYKTRPQWRAERGSSIILRIWGFLLTRLCFRRAIFIFSGEKTISYAGFWPSWLARHFRAFKARGDFKGKGYIYKYFKILGKHLIETIKNIWRY